MSVEIEHITKTFGKLRANDDITMSLQSGRIYAILGENGAGKSTLMKILSGYQPPDSGRIAVNGTDAHFHSPADALQVGIGMLHQDPLDIPSMSVVDNFVLGDTISGRRGMVPNRRDACELILHLAENLGFRIHPDTYIDNLTIGERQQLEIIRLLYLGAKTLILDEPTTGISADQKNALFTSLQRLAHENQMTIILVSHKLEDVQALCDEVYVLRSGQCTGHVEMPCPTDNLVTMMFGKPFDHTVRQPLPHTGRAADMVLNVKGLTASSESARRVALNEVSLEIEAGEVIGLAGLDGSGQTDLLRACAGLQRLTYGTIYLQGRDITHKSYHERRELGISFAPAGRLEEGLIAGLTLTEHFALVDQRGGRVDWRAANQRADSSIAHYKIRGRANSMIQSLSGGNQQRTLLALLPQNLQVLLLENPTRGLDVESAVWVWQQLLERRSQGTAIIFTSPDLDEISEYSDRIGVFFNGKVTMINDTSTVTHGELGRLIGGAQ